MSTTAPSARSLARSRRIEPISRTAREFCRYRSGVAGLTILLIFILLALLAPLLVSAHSLSVTEGRGKVLGAPNSHYWLGTDQYGRSVLAELISGARIPLYIGFLATTMAMIFGTSIGLIAGHFRGWIDRVFLRICEWFLVIPFLPLAIVLAVVLGPSLLSISFVIAITSWADTALYIRSQTLSIEERPYLERAKVLGAGHWRQMSKYILPNILPIVFANATLTVASAVLAETTLSFLGLGDPQRVSWGSMLDDAFSSGAISIGAWWFILPPGLCVVVVVLAFTLVGQTLEEMFNPRLRKGAP